MARAHSSSVFFLTERHDAGRWQLSEPKRLTLALEGAWLGVVELLVSAPIALPASRTPANQSPVNRQPSRCMRASPLIAMEIAAKGV